MKYFTSVLALAPVLALALPLCAARGDEPKADPFELWRKPDAQQQQQPSAIEKAMQPPSAAPAAPPAPPPPPPPAAPRRGSAVGFRQQFGDAGHARQRRADGRLHAVLPEKAI